MAESETANRCLTCGYDLRGLPEKRCPECGRPFDAMSRILDRAPSKPTSWYLRAAMICAAMTLSGPAGALVVLFIGRTSGPLPDSLQRVLGTIACLLLLATMVAIPASGLLLFNCLAALRHAKWYGNDKSCMIWATALSALPFVLLAGMILLAALRSGPWVVVGLAILGAVVVLMWRVLKRPA
jgi:hypothetical protein